MQLGRQVASWLTWWVLLVLFLSIVYVGLAWESDRDVTAGC